MPMTKKYQEFFSVDMQDPEGWEPSHGYPATSTVKQKILSDCMNTVKKTGGRTRLLRLGPGDRSMQPVVHDYWEEVFLVEGDMTVGADTNGEGGEVFEGFAYACRPPGKYHGPFSSEKGCLMFEVHYYDPT